MFRFLSAFFSFVTLFLKHFKSLQTKQETKQVELNKNKAQAYDKLQKALAARRNISDSIANDKRMSEDRFKRK
jgi:hypothetical protein